MHMDGWMFINFEQNWKLFFNFFFTQLASKIKTKKYCLVYDEYFINTHLTWFLVKDKPMN